jgi:uncharacterized protein (TIGR03083 family)
MIDVSAITDEDRVRLIQQELSVIEELGAQLSDEEWELPTDLPGWSVKDNLSHVIDFEGAAVGREHAPADIDVSKYEYLTDDFQRANERGIEWRRSRPGKDVLSEFAEIAPLRAKQLAAADQSQVSKPSDTPLGLVAPLRDLLMIRILDLFFHEQDIRRAVGKPGHLNGDVARTVFSWMATRALPRVVGKNSPEGTVALFDVGDDAVRVAVKDGKGALADDDVAPTVTFASDLEAFFCLVGGRRTHADLAASGRLDVGGDEAAAKSILENIVVVP